MISNCNFNSLVGLQLFQKKRLYNWFSVSLSGQPFFRVPPGDICYLLFSRNLPTSTYFSFMRWDNCNGFEETMELHNLNKSSSKSIHQIFEYIRLKNFGRSFSLPDPAISYKIFRTKWSTPIKLERKIKVWYLYFRVF